jgi:Uma2 family endonuclease
MMPTETPALPTSIVSPPAPPQPERVEDFPYPPTDLIDSDGEPLESHWHVDEINLLCDVVHCHFQQRDDFYAGGNMFIYFNRQQARDRDYRGPDFFFVNGKVSRTPMRRYWAVWDEGGRYPDVIIELMSKTTKNEDLTTKKEIYEKTFKTHEYFCFDPDTQQLIGWRLSGAYKTIEPNERGWLWSEVLGLWLGIWQGEYMGYHLPWLRFFDSNGSPVPTFGEAAKQQAEAAKQQAEAARQRADALAAELAQLKAQLAAKQ